MREHCIMYAHQGSPKGYLIFWDSIGQVYETSPLLLFSARCRYIFKRTQYYVKNDGRKILLKTHTVFLTGQIITGLYYKQDHFSGKDRLFYDTISFAVAKSIGSWNGQQSSNLVQVNVPRLSGTGAHLLSGKGNYGILFSGNKN